MEQVNEIGGKVVTVYSPNIEIERLIYVDDIANAGNKRCTEQAMEKVNILEAKKKATVNQIQSKYMIVNKKIVNDDDKIVTKFSDGNEIKMTDDYKYLGTWIASNGRCDLNIEERRKSCEQAFPKIVHYGSKGKVGNLSATIQLEQYEIIIVTIMLYNMEAWATL